MIGYKGCVSVSLLLGALLLGCAGDGVEDVLPASGTVGGNTEVKIMGKGFKPGATVYFGDKQCSNIVLEAGNIRVLSPPQDEEGRVHVIVINPDGTRMVSPVGFLYTKSAEWNRF